VRAIARPWESRGVGRDGQSFAKGSRATPEPRLEPGRRGGGPRDPCSAEARGRIARFQAQSICFWWEAL